MWIFTKDGLLMPAAVPPQADPVFTLNGLLDLQIRSRELKHLAAFMADYMDLMQCSDIQYTPSMDYEYRFYTTRQEFAKGVAKAVAAIDYEKFKPEAKDHNYHSTLNRIWEVVFSASQGSAGVRENRPYFDNHFDSDSDREFFKLYQGQEPNHGTNNRRDRSAGQPKDQRKGRPRN